MDQIIWPGEGLGESRAAANHGVRISISKKMEQEFDLYIPIYEKEVTRRGVNLPGSQYYMYGAQHEIYITVGNAYQFLKAGQAKVSVKEDASGFRVYKDGAYSTFGDEPELKLELVKSLMEEPDIVIELPSDILDYTPWLLEDNHEE